jgi:hypothetical protein
MIANGYAMQYPALYSSKYIPKKGAPKATGIMSKPELGAMVLFLSLFMLITLDGFLGIGYISLLLFGRSFDWESAFEPIHKKLGIGRHTVLPSENNNPSSSSSSAEQEREKLLPSSTTNTLGTLELGSHIGSASYRGSRSSV